MKRILPIVFIMIAIISCGEEESPLTCSNGVQDNNESAVDCGGECLPCESDCNDGVQNGNETGVDCGGDCTPCNQVPTPTKSSYFLGEVDGSWVLYERNGQLSNSNQIELNNNGSLCSYNLKGVVWDDYSFQTLEYSNGINIEFVDIIQTGCNGIDNNSTYQGLFPNGSYTYHTASIDGAIDIEYRENDVIYKSSLYGSQPASSSFSIISSEEATPLFSQDARKVTVNFSCMLESQNGVEKAITNAEAVITVYDVD